MMCDFGLLPGIRPFERHVSLDLLEVGDKLTAERDAYDVTGGKVYEVVLVGDRLHVTTDDPKGTYHTTGHGCRYQRHAKGPAPHFGWDDVTDKE